MTTARRGVDLNSDLGESLGPWRVANDDAMLRLVTSANLACGFHAGDPLTIDRTVALATATGIRVGAQVSYPDLVGFGRRRMDIAPEDLTADVIYQIGALQGFCRAHGTVVSYVKPHGALYNTIVHDERQAAAVVRAITRYDASLPLVTLPGSAAAITAVAAGLAVVSEGFADRAYQPDGSLVPRSVTGAVLDDVGVVAARAVRMVVDGEVDAIDGSTIALDVETICVHGDTPGAVGLADAVRTALSDAGVTIEPFA